jgi:hypothetical protein
LVKFIFNGPGWAGYFLFAAIGTLIWTYSFLPTVGGLNGCLTITPLYCASTYLVFHLPLGVAGFFVFSHLIGKHNVRLLLLLIAVVGCTLANIPAAHAQPVALSFVAGDYYPYTFWVDKPQNVSYATTLLGEYYVFEWAYFWPYHPVTFPSTCAASAPTYDWELVYVYVSFATQTTAGVAYRYHCNWTFVSQTDPLGVIAVQLPSSLSINATRPVITFIGKYHVPVNDYPYGTRFKADLTTAAIEFQGTYTYIQQDYNYSQVQALNPDSHPIDPGFFRGTNWYNVTIVTIAGFVISGITAIIFATEKKKLAGFN